jgi:hypothetical protein
MNLLNYLSYSTSLYWCRFLLILLPACMHERCFTMQHCNTLQWPEATRFRLHELHSMKPPYMKCRCHVILNFKNNLSTLSVFCDIEQHLKLHGTAVIYMTVKLNSSGSSVKFVSYFLLNIKFRTSVTNTISTPTGIHTSVPQGSLLSRKFVHK